MFSKSSNKKRAWNNAKKIKNYNFFDKIDSEEKAYWLGFILGDGFISKNRFRLGINLNIKDANHLQKFADLFNKTLRFKKEKSPASDYICEECVFEICNIYLVTKLKVLGIKPNKTYNFSERTFKKVPDNLFNHFIRGFLDADGCIHIEKNNALHLGFAGNNDLIQKIIDEICLRVGLSLITCRNTRRRPSKKANSFGTYYNFSGKSQVLKILSWVYSDSTIYLNRKKEIFEKALNLK